MAAPRYEALVKLASGGMATVWIGTARGALGFRQLVAIKKPHPHMLEQPGFRKELIAEARLASMIRHANVVDVRDVEEDGESISLVMDYIEGASLGELLVAASRRAANSMYNARIPPRVAVRIVRDACAGLHAAHELVDEKGRPVGLVHRDVSPQNILVGEDGIARVTDFGVAKFARKNMQSTSAGSLKGKLAYMAPEYLRSEPIDRRFDVFATGIVLWEALTGQRCFRGESEAETFRRILETTPPRVSSLLPELAPLDDVVATALEKSVGARFQNAAAMGAALETAASEAGLIASHTEVAATLKELVGALLAERRERVRSKLAHEPSLASLGADVVMSPLADLPPPTEEEAPPTTSDPRATTLTSSVAASRTAPIARANATLGLAPPMRDLAPPEPAPMRDFMQPVTSSAYEIEPAALPKKPLPIVPLVLGGVVLAGLAIAGGVSLGRAGAAPMTSAAPIVSSAPEPAASSPEPAPIASAAPSVSAAPVESVVEPPRTAAKSAAPRPKPVVPSPTPAPAPAPAESTKRPPANPYE